MAVSNVFSVSVASPPASALAAACAAIASNGSASFTTQSLFSIDDLEWQSSWHHDPIGGRVHLMAKPANINSAWRHQYYNIATNAFVSVTIAWNYGGHIYGNITMDYTTGDLYVTEGSFARRVNRYRLANGWDIIPGSDMMTGALNEINNGAVYHPHLFGTNDGGLIVSQEARTFFWRKSNGVVSSIAHGGQEFGRKEGHGTYFAATNQAFVGGGDTGGSIERISQGPVSASVGTYPISPAGISSLSGSGFGSLHEHPGNSSKLLLLETAGSRAYTSTNGSTWTQIGNHPFTRVPRVLCSLRDGLGCMWAIGRDATGHFSTLWRPPV